jgi:hypothetical protein
LAGLWHGASFFKLVLGDVPGVSGAVLLSLLKRLEDCLQWGGRHERLDFFGGMLNKNLAVREREISEGIALWSNVGAINDANIDVNDDSVK